MPTPALEKTPSGESRRVSRAASGQRPTPEATRSNRSFRGPSRVDPAAGGELSRRLPSRRSPEPLLGSWLGSGARSRPGRDPKPDCESSAQAAPGRRSCFCGLAPSELGRRWEESLEATAMLEPSSLFSWAFQQESYSLRCFSSACLPKRPCFPPRRGEQAVHFHVWPSQLSLVRPSIQRALKGVHGGRKSAVEDRLRTPVGVGD